MAKRQPELDNPLAPTEKPARKAAAKPRGGRQPRNPEDPVKSMGIGLRQSEWERLQALADSYDLAAGGMHSLAVWGLRQIIRQLENGEIQPPTETRSVIVDE